ncbi:helix-turn-helix domain-containing protein [Spirillospora sp. NPDC048911]|uniref:helix-turn-helix domain-containing protein n=1 Tax=Spirillospora sp. NPDC048911 TaxID=3364527 RepID=UPI003720A400
MARPERRLTPEKSALHRFGYELREWRKSRRLSQAKLAVKVHVSDDTIQKVETADRKPARDLVERLDRCLDAAGALIRQYELVERDGKDTDSTDRHSGDTDKPLVGIQTPESGLITPPSDEMMVMWMTALNGEQLPVMINRRAFVTGMAAVPAVGWLSGQVGASRLATPLAGGDMADVLRSMAELRTALATQDNILGPRTVVPTALHQLTLLNELSDGAAGRAREAVMNLQAAYAEFIGWLADDLGDRKAGLYWIDRALEWAHEGGDELVIGYTLARKAQRATEEGNPSATIGLARASQRSGNLPPRVRAAAALFEAQGHAASSERNNEAFYASIDRAREALASVKGPPAHGEWAPWCDAGYVAMHEADGWMRLGQPAKAVDIYRDALADWPTDMRRDQGVYYSRFARALAAAGQAEQAASAGSTALEIASRTGSARIVAQLKPLPAVLSGHCDSGTVRTFAANLNEHLNNNRTELK